MRRSGSSETTVRVASSSAGVAIGTTTARRALLEEGNEQLVRRAEPARAPRIEDERPSHPEEAAARELLHGLVSRHERAQRLLEPRVGDVDRPGDELVAPLVLHADDGRVGIEQLDGRLRHRVERRVEREALRKRARDLVQRPQSLCRLPLGGESLLALRGEPLRSLVQLSVLDGDGKLAGKRGEQRRLVRLEARAHEGGTRRAGRSAPLGRRAARRAPRRSAPRWTASLTDARRRSACASETCSIPCARRGPNASSSSRSATASSEPVTPCPASGLSLVPWRRYTATRSERSSSETRATAVSSVCASESSAVAWPTTASSASERSSSSDIASGRARRRAEPGPPARRTWRVGRSLPARGSSPPERRARGRPPAAGRA